MLTYENREMLGKQQVCSGAKRAWMGLVVIVVTVGSDMIEGGHIMWLGGRDDVTTYAFNPLLDTVYGGN